MLITRSAPDAAAALKIKGAMHARHYGASELMLATMTGQYPPPHDAMDLHVKGQLELKL